MSSTLPPDSKPVPCPEVEIGDATSAEMIVSCADTDTSHDEVSVELLLSTAAPAIARRIRALRRRESDWSMRTSELMSSAVRRVLVASHVGRVQMQPVGFWSLVETIVRNLLIDRYRRRRVRRAALERLRSDHSSRNLENSNRDMPSRDEDLVAAQRVLQSLSTRERELALLRMRGARWSDIARVLGVREEAARQRWTALRRRVQQELRDEAFGPQMPREIERTCTDQ